MTALPPVATPSAALKDTAGVLRPSVIILARQSLPLCFRVEMLRC